jgi:HSP20 family molecular chaperone IbpA
MKWKEPSRISFRKATFKDGVMRLVLPKAEPAKRRRIKVD